MSKVWFVKHQSNFRQELPFFTSLSLVVLLSCSISVCNLIPDRGKWKSITGKVPERISSWLLICIIIIMQTRVQTRVHSYPSRDRQTGRGNPWQVMNIGIRFGISFPLYLVIPCSVSTTKVKYHVIIQFHNFCVSGTRIPENMEGQECNSN